MHGRGKYVWPQHGQCYLGGWEDGLRHGKGRHHFASTAADVACGDYYDGSWRGGVMHGEGVYVDAGGGMHSGTWIEGVCPEVDFTHVPERGCFRYSFLVRFFARN